MSRFFMIISIVLLFAVQGNAFEESKIIAKTFYSEENANKGLNNIVKTMQSNPKMVEYQETYDFYFAVRKSGAYYIIIAEPFSNKLEINNVLKEIKKDYSGAFANKIKQGSKSLKVLKLDSSKYIKPKIESKPKVEPKPKIESKPKIKPKPKPKVEPKSKVAKYEEIEVIEIKEEKEPNRQLDIQDTELPEVTRDIESKKRNEVAEKISNAEKKIAADNKIDKEENSSGGTNYYLIGFFIILIAVLIFIILKLRRKNEELEHMVKYMHSTEVKSEYALAEEKEMFLAKVSHELRTPMGAIIGLSHLLLQGKLNDVQYNNVKKIKESGETILEIVNDILDITKIDAGALKIENIEFDINEVLEHLSSMTSLKAEEKGLELVYDIDKSVPSKLIGDPLRLGQILINLLDNSIKFTNKGAIELKINTIEDNFESKVGLEFRVIDAGIGMKEAELGNLFKDFTQADESISRKYGGSGLGLSIVKQLVDMMSGTINVKSEYGQGTEFIVKIYFTKYELNDRRHYRLPSKSLMEKNAIIVDSNTRSVDSLRNMLKYFHYKVEVVTSIESAQNLLTQVAYDLLFIDENVLLKSSVDSVKDIKNRYNLKIVLVESIYYQHNNDIRDIEEIDSYLLKPFNQNIVYNLILDLHGESNKVEPKKSVKKEDLLIFKNVNILVADDNELNLKIIKGLLDGTGFNLTTLNNGEELIEKLEEDIEVDLILLDINMGVMNGFETALEVRKIPKYKDTSIYALTAYTDKENMNKAMEVGMQGYFTKPLNVNAMYENFYNIFTEMGKNKDEDKEVKEKNPKAYLFKELDIDAGLENSNSDEKLYHALLNDFVNMYSDANSVIDSTVDEGRYSDTKNFVHDVKNLSEHLGGNKVSKSAAKIEEAFLNDNFNKNSILIDRFKRDLEKFILDVNKYLEGSE